MSDKNSNIKSAIMALAREIDSVFKRYSRQARKKAWEKISGKDGEREIKKILDTPGRSLSPFERLVTKRGSLEN